MRGARGLLRLLLREALLLVLVGSVGGQLLMLLLLLLLASPLLCHHRHHHRLKAAHIPQHGPMLLCPRRSCSGGGCSGRESIERQPWRHEQMAGCCMGHLGLVGGGGRSNGAVLRMAGMGEGGVLLLLLWCCRCGWRGGVHGGTGEGEHSERGRRGGALIRSIRGRWMMGRGRGRLPLLLLLLLSLLLLLLLLLPAALCVTGVVVLGTRGGLGLLLMRGGVCGGLSMERCLLARLVGWRQQVG